MPVGKVNIFIDGKKAFETEANNTILGKTCRLGDCIQLQLSGMEYKLIVSHIDIPNCLTTNIFMSRLNTYSGQTTMERFLDRVLSHRPFKVKL